MKYLIAALIIALLPVHANAQGYQCRTAKPPSTSSSYCASEAFVASHFPASSVAGHIATFADTSGNVLQDGGAPGSGTVTEQKNTAGYGLAISGNCDNTSTNASSPCNYAFNVSTVTNSLSSNVALTSTSTYADGPSVAQGVTGTWWVSGHVTLQAVTNLDQPVCKLWDGTTVIDSGIAFLGASTANQQVALSGFLASPAGNIKISCRGGSVTTSIMEFNVTGNSKDSTLSAHRIQ